LKTPRELDGDFSLLETRFPDAVEYAVYRRVIHERSSVGQPLDQACNPDRSRLPDRYHLIGGRNEGAPKSVSIGSPMIRQVFDASTNVDDYPVTTMCQLPHDLDHVARAKFDPIPWIWQPDEHFNPDVTRKGERCL
jgi:hypothetical protein